MNKQWIGCAQDNFHKGRPAGLKPEMIVLHNLDGSLADANARYSRPGSLVSMHYAVGITAAKLVSMLMNKIRLTMPVW